VTEPILFVDDTPQALEIISRLFESDYAITTAKDADEALELCRTRGPFAVVVSDYEMPGMRGAELLARVHEGWPETVTMLLTGVVEVDVAVEALHEGAIFRFLEKPCPRDILAGALQAGVAEYRRRTELRARKSELDFSMQCLQQFNGELDRRIMAQTHSLVRLHRFVSDLNSCDKLAQIAAAACEAASEICDVTGAEVAIATHADGSEPHVSACGKPLDDEREFQAVADREGVLGSISIPTRSAEGLPLGAAQRHMLASIAASTAVAARNAMRRRERDEAQQATIFALAKLAEQRDNETGKHLERVSAICRLVAEGLRDDGFERATLTSDWIDVLALSAPLHDIGKVGIPDSILLKPGKLTPEEWQVMRTHCEIGADTLRSVMKGPTDQPFLRMSLDIAWCHHEKWDGSGYPRGLAGEAIPLSARITALADVYDALTSERPYKKPWTHEAAVAWILQGAGAHFDPSVVETFARRADAVREIGVRLADT
jgi:response regulator RpfG family c-di-GMP phosphodiesterase